MRFLLEAVACLGIGFFGASVWLSLTRSTDLPSTKRSHSVYCSLAVSERQYHNGTNRESFRVRSEPFWKSRRNESMAAYSYGADQTDADGLSSIWQSSTSSSSSSFSTQFATLGQQLSSHNDTLDAVFFLRQPQRFVQQFRDCQEDKHCHVVYHHVPKTGGTSVEAAMFEIFGQPMRSSCCNEPLLESFRKNPDFFCGLKFTSWQMDYPYFFEVIDTCFQRDRNKQMAKQQAPKRRVLILVTFREPTSTTLSFIHQKCNKNLDKRTKRVQEACRTCDYESHADIWDKLQRRVSAELEGAWHVMHLLQTPTGMVHDYDEDEDDEENLGTRTLATGKADHKVAERTQTTHFHFPTDRMQLALMEPNDINAFLQAWHPEKSFRPSNPETLTVCNFHMPSKYIARLASAGEWYRRFVAGVA